jgi:hypothetical protein
MRDDLIPTACVESSSVAQEDRRIPAGPLKKRDLDTVHFHSALDGHFYSV